MTNKFRYIIDSLTTIHGTTIKDEVKILFMLVSGYMVYLLYNLFEWNFLNKFLGNNHIEFIEKIENIGPLFCRFSDGSRFFISRPDDYWAVSPTWEPEINRVFKPNLGDTVIDIGAHMGGYTIRISKIVGDKGLVIALEAERTNYEFLKKNIKINKLKNVIVLPYAVFNKDGTAIIHKSKITGCHSLVMKPPGFTSDEVVPTITLDTLVNKYNINRIDWVKIDVEGAELNVLKGAENSLNIIRNIIIESWHKNTNDLLKIFILKNFNIKKIQTDKLSTTIFAHK